MFIFTPKQTLIDMMTLFYYPDAQVKNEVGFKMILSCILLALSSFLLPAQNQFDLQFKQYRTKDGLPNNTIRHIFQDSKGFL